MRPVMSQQAMEWIGSWAEGQRLTSQAAHDRNGTGD